MQSAAAIRMEPGKDTGQATRKHFRVFAVCFIIVCVVYHSETLGLQDIISYEGIPNSLVYQ